jgi:hypothetical protein
LIHKNAPLDKITDFVEHQFLIRVQNKKENVLGSKIIKSKIFAKGSSQMTEPSIDSPNLTSILKTKEDSSSSSSTLTNPEETKKKVVHGIKTRGIIYYAPTVVGLLILYFISILYGLNSEQMKLIFGSFFIGFVTMLIQLRLLEDSEM